MICKITSLITILHILLNMAITLILYLMFTKNKILWSYVLMTIIMVYNKIYLMNINWEPLFAFLKILKQN
jgi:hypothetical protein